MDRDRIEQWLQCNICTSPTKTALGCAGDCVFDRYELKRLVNMYMEVNIQENENEEG